MFFIASKIFWLLAQPLSMVLLLLLGSMLFFALGWRRLGMVASGFAALIMLVVGFTNFGYVIIQPLEDRFAVPAEPPQNVEAIIMLGGATMARPSVARGIAELNDAGDRLTTTLWLANQYPEAKIVVSGGSGVLSGEDEPEAATVERFLLAHGVAAERLVLESGSRNTEENVDLTMALLGEEREGAIVLVTSAFHMPRSVGIFEKAGVDVVPWPTDYRTPGPRWFGFDIANPVQNLNVSTVAMKEWIGLVMYSLSGRTAEFLPGA